jgi:hypothetical protein
MEDEANMPSVALGKVRIAMEDREEDEEHLGKHVPRPTGQT